MERGRMGAAGFRKLSIVSGTIFQQVSNSELRGNVDRLRNVVAGHQQKKRHARRYVVGLGRSRKYHGKTEKRPKILKIMHAKRFIAGYEGSTKRESV